MEEKKCSCPYCPGHQEAGGYHELLLEEGPDQQMTFDEFIATLQPITPPQGRGYNPK